MGEAVGTTCMASKLRRRANERELPATRTGPSLRGTSRSSFEAGPDSGRQVLPRVGVSTEQ